MPIRRAEAQWEGNLAEGNGRLKVESGAFDGPYSFKSRFEEGQSATNPEELIGAAHAGCFTMALTAQLTRAGRPPTGFTPRRKSNSKKLATHFRSPGLISRLKPRYRASTMRRFRSSQATQNRIVRFRKRWLEQKSV